MYCVLVARKLLQHSAGTSLPDGDVGGAFIGTVESPHVSAVKEARDELDGQFFDGLTSLRYG